jgi:hypothetical protein
MKPPAPILFLSELQQQEFEQKLKVLFDEKRGKTNGGCLENT